MTERGTKGPVRRRLRSIAPDRPTVKDGHLEERAAPTRLRSHTATLVDVYGSLHYAGARTLEGQLPDPAGTASPVQLYLAGAVVGASSLEAFHYAEARADAQGGASS